MAYPHNGLQCNCKKEWERCLWTDTELFAGYNTKQKKQSIKEYTVYKSIYITYSE